MIRCFKAIKHECRAIRPASGAFEVIAKAYAHMEREKEPFALLVKKETFEKYRQELMRSIRKHGYSRHTYIYNTFFYKYTYIHVYVYILVYICAIA